MPSLFWPGEHRADELLSDAAFLRALVEVEQAWLHVLGKLGVAPGESRRVLADLVGEDDLGRLALDAEAGGNPVIPLVSLLRERLPEPAATWVHRGLTSQDVLDTALMLCARAAVGHIRSQLAAQIVVLAELAEVHRATPMVARTLGQYAVPTTFGAKAASWLQGILDADDELSALRFPVQLGGAAGTLSAVVELAGASGARAARTDFAVELGLAAAAPWHTVRTAVTRIGDAAVRATDAWGRLANDVLVLGRPEVGEVVDTSAGSSSTMPQKDNPVRAVLVRRAALAAPSAAATLHLAAAEQVDERATGGWHVEWETLATLLRRTVVAADHTTGLLSGLEVRPQQMAARLESVHEQLRAEQQTMAALAGRDPEARYDGLAGDLIDETLERVRLRGLPPAGSVATREERRS